MHRYIDKYTDAQMNTQIRFKDGQTREDKAFHCRRKLTNYCRMNDGIRKSLFGKNHKTSE